MSWKCWYSWDKLKVSEKHCIIYISSLIKWMVEQILGDTTKWNFIKCYKEKKILESQDRLGPGEKRLRNKKKKLNIIFFF